MKLLLIILFSLIIGLFIGDYLKGANRYHESIGQVKKTTITRCFFVGYSIGGKADGNMQWYVQDGQTPKKAEIYKFIKKEYPDISFEYKELVIVGLYEFKNKKDCDQFYDDQNKQP